MAGKPCKHCGHLKGRHGHRINQEVPPQHPNRVRHYCVGDCFCRGHSDWDPTGKMSRATV